MELRKLKQHVRALATMEGAGVTVHRTIGTNALRHLDPFVMLDHFSSENPDEYIAGFPDHPHRGFNTFTYMLDGHMQHKDSMGNHGNLQSGGAQWMTAGSGVIHSEMPQQSHGLMRGFQLWINLPAQYKMSDPAYQEYSPTAFPVIQNEGQQIKILIGEIDGKNSPVKDPHTHVLYCDVSLHANRVFSLPLPGQLAAFIYVFEGTVNLCETQLDQHNLAVLGKGDTLKLTAGECGARFILVAGAPINEPIVQYGPFVMNTTEEIHQAVADFRAGNLVRGKASFTTDKPR